MRDTFETWMRLAAARLRPDHAPEPLAAHQRRPSAGAATSPSTGISSSTNEISVAQAGTPRTKLWVPSMGSITQRRGPWPVVSNSSPSTASRGRVRLSWHPDELLGGLVGVADEREVRLRLDGEVLGAKPGHGDPLDRVGQHMRQAEVIVIGHPPTLARPGAGAAHPPRHAVCRVGPAQGSGQPAIHRFPTWPRRRRRATVA